MSSGEGGCKQAKSRARLTKTTLEVKPKGCVHRNPPVDRKSGISSKKLACKLATDVWKKSLFIWIFCVNFQIWLTVFDKTTFSSFKMCLSVQRQEFQPTICRASEKIAEPSDYKTRDVPLTHCSFLEHNQVKDPLTGSYWAADWQSEGRFKSEGWMAAGRHVKGKWMQLSRGMTAECFWLGAAKVIDVFYHQSIGACEGAGRQGGGRMASVWPAHTNTHKSSSWSHITRRWNANTHADPDWTNDFLGRSESGTFHQMCFLRESPGDTSVSCSTLRRFPLQVQACAAGRISPTTHAG